MFKVIIFQLTICLGTYLISGGSQFTGSYEWDMKPDDYSLLEMLLALKFQPVHALFINRNPITVSVAEVNATHSLNFQYACWLKNETINVPLKKNFRLRLPDGRYSEKTFAEALQDNTYLNMSLKPGTVDMQVGLKFSTTGILVNATHQSNLTEKSYFIINFKRILLAMNITKI